MNLKDFDLKRHFCLHFVDLSRKNFGVRLNKIDSNFAKIVLNFNKYLSLPNLSCFNLVENSILGIFSSFENCLSYYIYILIDSFPTTSLSTTNASSDIYKARFVSNFIKYIESKHWIANPVENFLIYPINTDFEWNFSLATNIKSVKVYKYTTRFQNKFVFGNFNAF